MKFIVEAIKEDSQSRGWPPRPPKDPPKTMCALCSEDPRFCW